MTTLTPYLLIVWVVIVLALFPTFRRHRAIIATLLAGLLFLPQVGSKAGDSGDFVVEPISLSPFHFTKDLTISYALLFAVLLYDPQRLLSLRWRWFDLPMVAWCLCPMASVLTNAPPPDGSPMLRDGFSQLFHQTVTWGVPYLLGRLYFSDLRALRDLAFGVVLAAVAYAPLCLFEVRMSPQLHRIVYGFSQHSFAQTIRFDGYRPMVFFSHGLSLAIWMVTALLMAGWLWWNGTATEGDGRSKAKGLLGCSLLVLLPTTVLLKSTGALALGMLGLGILFLSKLVPTRLWVILLAVLAPLYVAVRITGTWDVKELVERVKEDLGKDRGESLEFRITNENLLIKRALEQPFFGWGGWGRNRVEDDQGKDSTVTDGLWLIALGDRGLVGLIALWAVLLLPILRFSWLFPPRTWGQPLLAPALVCAVAVVLWSIDSLMNGLFNHLFPLLSGALLGLEPAAFRQTALHPFSTKHSRRRIGSRTDHPGFLCTPTGARK
jgi:hypothetical protein